MKHNDNDKDKTDDEDKYETIQKTAKAPVGLNDPAFSDEEICDSVRPIPPVGKYVNHFSVMMIPPTPHKFLKEMNTFHTIVQWGWLKKVGPGEKDWFQEAECSNQSGAMNQKQQNSLRKYDFS